MAHEVCAIRLWAQEHPARFESCVLDPCCPCQHIPGLSQGSQGSLAAQAVSLPLLPPQDTSGCLWLCSAAPGATSSSSSRTRIRLLLPVWLKVRVTLCGSGHPGLAGISQTGKGERALLNPHGFHGWTLGQAWAVVLKWVGCRQGEGRAGRECGFLAASGGSQRVS